MTVCEQCGERYVNPGGHAERCTGPREPVADVARKILAGEAFCDVDAVRVARAFLEATA